MAARKPDDSFASQAGKYLGVGITLALCTGLFLYLGTVADKKLGTEPLFTLLGAFVGAAAGFYNLYRTMMTAQAEADRSRGEGDR